MKYSLVLGGVATVISASAVMATTPEEVKSIAQTATVEIHLQQNQTMGSGVIVNRVAAQPGNNQGDLYTLITNGHVVCGANYVRGKLCTQLPSGEQYSLRLVDGQQIRVSGAAIKLSGQNLDLAVVQFRSSRNYKVAQVAAPGSLQVNDPVFTAGFPFHQPRFSFNRGKAIAVVNKRLTSDGGGYGVIYDASTLPGMSGGGVFDENGQLVAIHGLGDRYKKGTELDDSKLGSKIGYNRGIPVRWVVQSLNALDIYVGGQGLLPQPAIAPTEAVTADEHFIAGFNQHIDPGTDVLAGKRLAIQELSKAIQLNPKYAVAYFTRAYVYGQVGEVQLALRDWDQVIAIDPQNTHGYNNRGVLKQQQLSDVQGALNDYSQAIMNDPRNTYAYNNRGLLKDEMLNDVAGAMADYNQAIAIDPNFTYPYNNRGLLKKDKLNDFQGALADFNQAINLDPNDAYPVHNRALLKDEKLNDVQGALADFNQAIAMNPKFAKAYNNRGFLKDERLNDTAGALADFNQALAIDPRSAVAYNNRGFLKYKKLRDIQGALTDFNQAIALKPKYAEAYGNRAILKYAKLQDRRGAILDLQQAARLFREQGKMQYWQLAIEQLRHLGATETSD